MGPSPYAFRGISDLLMSIDLYEVRPHKVYRGVNLISVALPLARLWYGGPNAVTNSIGYAKFCRRSHRTVIKVFDDAGNVIATHEQAGEFKKRRTLAAHVVRMIPLPKCRMIRHNSRHAAY
jgi:hypothetical protein